MTRRTLLLSLCLRSLTVPVPRSFHWFPSLSKRYSFAFLQKPKSAPNRAGAGNRAQQWTRRWGGGRRLTCRAGRPRPPRRWWRLPPRAARWGPPGRPCPPPPPRRRRRPRRPPPQPPRVAPRRAPCPPWGEATAARFDSKSTRRRGKGGKTGRCSPEALGAGLAAPAACVLGFLCAEGRRSQRG